MTIAACYVSSEGVVFGADSTVTVTGTGRARRHYDHAQKIFQVGHKSTLGIAFWGLAGLPQVSHRTLVARLADQLATHPPETVADVARHWADLFWAEYSSQLNPFLLRANQLAGLPQPTELEKRELLELRQRYSLGFCLGGHLPPDRQPAAFEILFDPTLAAPPSQQPLTSGNPVFWGQQNQIYRLILGVDLGFLNDILNSGQWSGTQQELVNLLKPYSLGTVRDLPIREAIDWVHTAIYTTNRAFKFSDLPPVCGGPVELAVITTDREFRWVRHKHLDAALVANGNNHGPYV